MPCNKDGNRKQWLYPHSTPNLIKECERLLSDSYVDPDIKEKTGYVLNVAQDAKNEESTVMLYFDPEA